MSDWWITYINMFELQRRPAEGVIAASRLENVAATSTLKKYVGLFQRKAGGSGQAGGNARHMISLQVVKYSTQCLDAPGSG